MGALVGSPWGSAASASEPAFSYADYGAVLKKYVDDNGLVNYRGLKSDRKALDTLAASIARLDPKTFAGWSEQDKIAFLINAYNALTLVAIIDHYPIEWSYIRSVRFPRNSIRQIAGVWDEIRFPVMGRKMTLDDIEHRELRAKFNEPRIHMALVCAALGCPILRNEPYTGAKLNAQLDDQARKFMKNPKKFRVDRKEGRVYLSSIFKWFGDDFAKRYGTKEKFKKFGDSERAVLNFVSTYLRPEEKQYLENGTFSIEYLPYDWTLNEKKQEKGKSGEAKR
jgi:hypothetical protein